MKLIVYFTLFLASVLCFAQKQNPFITTYQANQSSRFYLEKKITAVVVDSEKDLGEFVTAKADNKLIKIPRDHDSPEFAYFISLPEDANDIFFPEKITAKITLIHSGEAPKILPKKNSNGSRANACAFTFNSIPQSEWRKNLPPPNYRRGFSKVNHVVVHHSAGSNTATDFVQVVRNVYVYHTQTRKWSDIGYNYLIAPDGTIFKGRDPDGGSQHNVRGAHFCGGNTGTMGICLLGNYETAEPTPATLSSLEKIIKFKLNEEQLTPFTTNTHRHGRLPALVGHRDGCSTKCPGKNVYKRLESLRKKLTTELKPCITNAKKLAFSTSKTRVNIDEEILFTNESTGYETYEWTFSGAKKTSANWKGSGTNSWAKEGIYSVKLTGTKNGVSKTLTKPSLITVINPRKLAFVASQTTVNIQDDVIFTNKSTGYSSYQWLLENAETPTANWQKSGSTKWKTPGSYSVSLIGKSKTKVDTLTRPFYITVKGPLFYPSLIKAGKSIHVDTGQPIFQVNLISMNGTALKLTTDNQRNFIIPQVESGVYVLEIETLKGYSRSLIIIN